MCICMFSKNKLVFEFMRDLFHIVVCVDSIPQVIKGLMNAPWKYVFSWLYLYVLIKIVAKGTCELLHAYTYNKAHLVVR